jgi:hypothetical protein
MRGLGLRTRLRALALIVAAVLVSAPACATTAQVEEIVARSNAAMLAAGPLGDARASADPQQLTDEAARIEAFVAAHPDQPALTAPLLVRLAMLYATHRMPNLATEAFGRVDGAALHSERDRALFALREHLPWWYSRAPEGTLPGGDFAHAQSALADFASVCDGLDAHGEARLFLEEMRVWIASLMAKESRPEVGREVVAEAVERFVEVLDPHDVVPALAPREEFTKDSEIVRTRRSLRGLAALERLRADAALQGISPAWRPEWLAAWMARR